MSNIPEKNEPFVTIQMNSCVEQTLKQTYNSKEGNDGYFIDFAKKFKLSMRIIRSGFFYC